MAQPGSPWGPWEGIGCCLLSPIPVPPALAFQHHFNVGNEVWHKQPTYQRAQQANPHLKSICGMRCMALI